MTYRLRNIGIAIALAMVAGLLTVFYVTNYKEDVRAQEENITVWVAGQDIPEGTTGEEIVRQNLLAEQSVAQRSVTPGAITTPEQLVGRVTSDKIYEGEQVSTRRFTTEEAEGVRGQISGNERAIQVAGSEPQLLAGTLQDGDHVDVVGSWNVPENQTNHVSRVILREILVIEAPKQSATTEKLTNPNQAGLSVILALTDAQAQKLFWIAKNGDWTLQLRPVDDAADSPESAESALSLLRDGMRPVAQP
jgi:Flp pilus assembly protein CpaB